MLKELPERLRITPRVLVWARETAGLSLEQAAAKLSVTTNRLAAMEAGEVDPTRRQLDNFARVFRRPTVVFFLRNPPLQHHQLLILERLQGKLENIRHFFCELCYATSTLDNRCCEKFWLMTEQSQSVSLTR